MFLRQDHTKNTQTDWWRDISASWLKQKLKQLHQHHKHNREPRWTENQLAAFCSYGGGLAVSTLMCDFSKQHDTNGTQRTNHLGSHCRCGRLKRFKITEYVKRSDQQNHDDGQTGRPQDEQKDDGHELYLGGRVVLIRPHIVFSQNISFSPDFISFCWLTATTAAYFRQ